MFAVGVLIRLMISNLLEEKHMAKDSNSHWMEAAFANSHGQFKAKAKAKGESTAELAAHPGKGASTKTKHQANLAKLGTKYGGR